MGSGRMGWRGACGVLALPWNANGQELQDPGGIWGGGLEGDLGRGAECSRACDGSAKC